MNDDDVLSRLILAVASNGHAIAVLDSETVRHIKDVALRLRRRELKKAPTPAQKYDSRQLVLEFKVAWRHRARSTRRPCKYPFQMVEDARKMRNNGYFYKEIAEALEKQYATELNGARVPWITVRDWTNHYYRVLK